MKTVLTIEGDRFLINGFLTYSELPGANASVRGLLMNARMIQGVFDDKADAGRFNRFGKIFDPDVNTAELIAALPEWYACGLRAFTVGFQGGGPCYTIDNDTIRNSPYGEDGASMDSAYLSRMKRLLLAADELGMAVIVSLFYGAQTRLLRDDKSVMRAVKTACNWLRDNGFSNVIVEIANEHDISAFQRHPILYTESGIVELLEIARRESGGLPVGCSGQGGYFDTSIAQASDVILIHGNGQTRQHFYNLVQKAKSIRPARPIVCNEDSQAISQLEVSFKTGVSWGYYNNMTKQEPPVRWGITPGEDAFFAARISEYLGIAKPELALEDQFYLQGLEPHMTWQGKRWIRLASLYPEKINYVDFFRDGVLVGSAYDDPFMLNSVSNWMQREFDGEIGPGEEWRAGIVLTDGRVVEKTRRTSF